MRSYPAYDKVIQVEFRAFPAMFWLSAGYEVRVGGRVFHPRLDRLTIFGQPWTEFEIEHQGGRLTGMVRGVRSWGFGLRHRYSLVVGLSELARDTQTMRGWPLALLMVATLSLLAVLAFFGANCLWVTASRWQNL